MKKIVLPAIVAGILMTISNMIISIIMNKVVPGIMTEYQTPGLFRPWSDPLMQAFFAHPFILALALAYVWDKIKGSLPGNRVLGFVWGCFLVATLPGMFISYTSFQISLAMTLSWTLTSVVSLYVATLVLNKMNG